MGRGAGSDNTQVFTRQRTDTLAVTPLDGTDDFFLVEFQPARPDDFGDNGHSGFITAADKAKLEAADDPVDAYNSLTVRKDDPYGSRKRAVELYTVLTEEGEKLLTETPLERWLRDNDWDFIADPKEAAANGPIDPDKIVRFDSYDHTFWKPGTETPISRPQEVTIWGTHFDVHKVEELVKDNPLVLATEIVEVPHYNREIAGPEEINITVRLPQDTYDKMWHWAKDKDGHRPDLRAVIMIGGAAKKDADSYNNDLAANGFDDLLGIRSAAISEEERDRITSQYADGDHWE